MLEGYVEIFKPEQIRKFAEASDFPSMLSFEVTERCNNNCIHCNINLPLNDKDALARELSTDDFLEIITEAASRGCFEVRFTGGEPLIKDGFEKLYLLTRRLGVKVVLYTNAVAITPEHAALFKKYPPGREIEVTVYGLEEKSYEGVSRVKGSFEAAMRGIKLLRKYNIPFIVKSALLPSNEDEFERFEQWSFEVTGSRDIPSRSMFFDLRARRDSRPKNQRIAELRISPEEGVKIIARNSDVYKETLLKFCQNFSGPKGDILFDCGAGRSGNIDAYGFIQPCLPLRHPETIYDLKKGSLAEAFKKFFPEVRKIRAKNQEYLNKCSKCVLFGLCEQCPAKSWMEHGTLDTPVDYFCRIAHHQARFIGLLNDNEHGWEVANGRERLLKLSETINKM